MSSNHATHSAETVSDFTLCSDPKVDGAHILQSESGNIRLELTYNPLDPAVHLAHIRSPHAGANVLFTGTTRADTVRAPTGQEEPPNDDGPPRQATVTSLCYTSYIPRCLLTLRSIAEGAVRKFGLHGLSIAHRLGTVGVGEESIVIAVSAGHRHVAWEAAEEVLEECKKRIEVWKKDVVGEGGGDGGDGGTA